jgi:hypothetical protein
MKLQFLDFPHEKGFCFEEGANGHALFGMILIWHCFFYLD